MTDGADDEYITLTTEDGAKLARYIEDLRTWVRLAEVCLRDDA